MRKLLAPRGDPVKIIASNSSQSDAIWEFKNRPSVRLHSDIILSLANFTDMIFAKSQAWQY